jgi:hypothetical protein
MVQSAAAPVLQVSSMSPAFKLARDKNLETDF